MADILRRYFGSGGHLPLTMGRANIRALLNPSEDFMSCKTRWAMGNGVVCYPSQKIWYQFTDAGWLQNDLDGTRTRFDDVPSALWTLRGIQFDTAPLCAFSMEGLRRSPL